MPVNILMPALSPTMEKGNLAKWLKQEGDTVKSGDVIAEIETDKATMEVEAVDEGVLAKILVPEGTQDIPVNQPIAVIAAEGEDVKAAAAGAAGAARSAAPPAPGPAAPAAAAAAAPAPRASGGEGGAARAPAQTRATSGNGHTPGGRIFASPLARRLAREANLDLASIMGSGPHGRIIERDIRGALSGGTARQMPAGRAPQREAPAQAPRAVVSGMADQQIAKLFEPSSYEEVPHDSIRKIVARRITEAKQTIPHFYLTLDCELDALLAAREAINAAAPKKDGKSTFKVSVNDFVIKALAVAMVRVPDANVTWTETVMLRHKHVDVGVAVAIPGGLITPIVRKAETKGLAAISNEMKDFIARAKNRRLKPEEYQGGSTAVSNLGMYGIKDFAAVINPPHATILAVGTGEKRVIVKDGAPAVATLMTVTLSTDHRAVDGALGAELLAAFKQCIENPAMMLM
jgi:pyruvate dehydrogenase E2 component (dihydrolipoyllysine-residue acetyltransferase)